MHPWGTGLCFQDSSFANLSIWIILPATVCLIIVYIEVTLVALPRLLRGYLQRLFCSCPSQVGVDSTVAKCVEAKGHYKSL